jgi:L-iditol 2-dehydrogenase
LKAVLKTGPGVGVEVRDVPYPKMDATSVIMKTLACGICGADLEVYQGRLSKFATLPMIMGHEVSGEIVEVGEEVTDFTAGDRVVIQPFTGMCGKCYYCKTGQAWSCPSRRMIGGMAEYVAVPHANLYRIPATVTPEEAPLCEPFAVALHALHAASFRILETAAVLGPGPVGLMTLLALRAAGTGLVVVTGTGNDVSPRLELAATIGADATVNVDEENPVDTVKTLTHGLGVDVVFDTTGSPRAGPQGMQMLKTKGRMIVIGHYPGDMALTDPSYKGYSITGNVSYDWDTWERLMPYLERRPVDFASFITHRLPLDEADKGFQLAALKKSVKVVLEP